MASFLSLSIPKLNLIKASSASSTTSTTTTTLRTSEALNEKFGKKGIKFLESNIVELTVRNVSSLSLSIPDAHVTSYKPKVYWKDDRFEEALYTIPATDGTIGSYKAKGGIGFVLNEALQLGPKELLPSTLEWTVSDVDFDSIDALQVPYDTLLLQTAICF